MTRSEHLVNFWYCSIVL